MIIYIGDLTVPKYGQLKELVAPNAKKIRTLDGTLNVDVVNQMRVWQLSWDYMTEADYQSIRTKYDQQFSTGTLFYFGIPELSINKQVYIELNDKEIRWNRSMASNVVLTISERYGVS